MLPSYKDNDSICLKKISNNDRIQINDIVVFRHPFKKHLKLIKRVAKISKDSKIFVEGDNKNALSSEDSHNFGYINKNAIIAIKRDHNDTKT